MCNKAGDTYLHYGTDGRIAKVGPNADAKSALAVGYTTNALGQRVFKSDARTSGTNASSAITQQTVYAEDGIGSTVLGQYGNRRSSNSGAPTGEMDSTEVIWLPTASGPLPVAAQINGRLYAIDADHLNTPRRLTNTQGQVVWQWLITGFGEANPTTGATGYAQSGQASGRTYGEAVLFDLRYPGQVWDEETGLSYNLHRYYDAGTGRYIQVDPIGLTGGWNRFGYANANPIKYIDPTGLFVPLVIPGVCAAGGCEAVGAVLAAGAIWWANNNTYIKPPANAYDPNGPKAPGKPSEADGFKSPKGGDNWVPNPNPGKGGSSWGWQDAKGDVWCPTGQGGNAHGGPHWDVQTPGGDYRNVKPRW
ncbi:RHS repeat-associated core domain-containing protein [Paracidovorax anthurii]|uniref:RHS repeat-associated core domain-containing protein n=1 Tax=Paracidovorax anthurii TaxID=78229 RepID=UPI0011BF5159|nr:RHS repeat-associated core domain-containing protein [Paracidovorax anthurii]